MSEAKGESLLKLTEALFGITTPCPKWFDLLVGPRHWVQCERKGKSFN